MFDVKNDWNSKNQDKVSRGRWQEATSAKHSDQMVTYAEAPARSSSSSDYGRPASYGWLCDLVNMFGDRGGFDFIVK